MKKICLIILLFFISIINVEASALNLKTLKENLQKSDIYQEFKEEGSTCSISSSNTYFNISCKLGTEGTYKTNLSYSKGILSYKFDGSKSSSETYEETLFDAFWLVEIANCIATHYGIDIGSNMIERVYNLTQNNYTLAKHGVESTYFKYNVGQETGYAFDTFKIYVNDGTIKEETTTNSNTTTNSESNTNNNTNTNSGNNNSSNNNSSSSNSSSSSNNTSSNSNNNNSSSNTNQSNQTNSNQNSNSSSNTEEKEEFEEDSTYEDDQEENNEENNHDTNNNINDDIENIPQQNQTPNQNSNSSTNKPSSSVPSKNEPENNKRDDIFNIKNIFNNDPDSKKNINSDLILIILIVISGSMLIFLITRKPKNK